MFLKLHGILETTSQMALITQILYVFHSEMITFKFSHLTDAFIQSNL